METSTLNFIGTVSATICGISGLMMLIMNFIKKYQNKKIGNTLIFVSVNDVIVELQKKKIINSKQFSNLVTETVNKGTKTLYLAIYNSSNQRSYITVKLK